ncbi:ATP-binding protein [Actinomadura sp. LOL_016]|uniref:ATP-binding protein n=1 Tax=unclassified Actinomadura TaxID=2626254 RepID=UPI003A80C064
MTQVESGLPALEAWSRADDDLAEPTEGSDSKHGLIVHALPDGRAGRRARALVREVLENVDVGESEITDAELAVGELAANADTHSFGPYELRIVLAAGQPVWCEVIDANVCLAGIPQMFAKLDSNPEPGDPVNVEDPPQENGHGLAIVHRLSRGRCGAYPTVMHTTGLPGKAVAFALPDNSGSVTNSVMPSAARADSPQAPAPRTNR